MCGEGVGGGTVRQREGMGGWEVQGGKEGDEVRVLELLVVGKGETQWQTLFLTVLSCFSVHVCTCGISVGVILPLVVSWV